MPEIHNKIEYQGRTLHYRDEGRNNTKTVVLLHGLLQNITVWSSVTLKMMRNYRVISIDLPGHGYTDVYNRDVHTMEFMAGCVNEVLIHAGVKDCVIVGHSWGGYVAQAYAESYEYNVKGIGLIHSHALSDSPEKQAQRREVCEEVRKNRPSYIIQFIPSLFAPLNQVALSREIDTMKDQSLQITADAIIAAQMGMIRRKSSVPFLSRTSRPVALVYGKRDNRIPLELAMAMATLPQHARLLLLDNVGHMAHLESPLITTRWISDFVDICYNSNM